MAETLHPPMLACDPVQQHYQALQESAAEMPTVLGVCSFPTCLGLLHGLWMKGNDLEEGLQHTSCCVGTSTYKHCQNMYRFYIADVILLLYLISLALKQ